MQLLFVELEQCKTPREWTTGNRNASQFGVAAIVSREAATVANKGKKEKREKILRSGGEDK
jgi:hypothetical protein